jgi:hypothetical protein
MGNLSNLYISQSFISLIHLGSNNTASGVSTQLEDGLGNGIGIYVNTSGSVSASSYSGSVNGIGNVSAFSTSVDSRLDNLELFSSSLDATFATDAQLNASSSTLQANINTKLDTASFNTFSSSQFEIEVSQSQQISASFATASAYSASLQSSILAVSSSISSSNGNTTTLSASIYQTDTTQSFQIGANAATASGYSASLSTTITNNSSSNYQVNATQSFQITANALTASNATTALSQSLYFTDTTQSANINSLTALTSSYARINQNNTFAAGTTQSFDYLVANSASITYLKVIFQTSSVVYSSGSNILGDEANADVQTLIGRNILTGSAEVTGSLRVTSDISSSTISGIGNVTLYSASVAASITSSTANVTLLSQSLYFTDTTQSVNITQASASAWGAFQSASAYSASNYQTDSTQSFQITANALTASNATTALSQSLWFTDTTQSVNLTNLSSSIAQTDFTQSYQIVANALTASTALTNYSSSQSTLNNTFSSSIATNSSSVGLLQTFSGSEYKADSSSFNSRINAAGGTQVLLDEGTILGNATAFNFIGSGVTATLSAGTASVTIPGGGGSIYTGSFAITGSNTFSGSQIINGDVNITGSLTASGLKYPTTDGLAGQFILTDGVGTLAFDDVHVLLEDVRYGEDITLGDPLYVNGSSGTRPIVFKADASNAAKMPVTYIAKSTGVTNTNTTALTLGLITGVTTTGYAAGTTIYVAEGGGWTSSRPSGSTSIVQPLGIVTKEGAGGSGRGVILNSGPAFLPNIQTGYTWIGNGTNQPTAVATSSFVNINQTGSFATTGSNSFVGNQTITGSLIITGSVSTLPVALSVTSNTASIDFSKGSIFTLTLPSSSVKTYITASNLIPGQTANLLVTQASTLSGSIQWASAFKFPSGSSYTGSAVVNAVDLISFITVNNSTIYSVGAQNLI